MLTTDVLFTGLKCFDVLRKTFETQNDDIQITCYAVRLGKWCSRCARNKLDSISRHCSWIAHYNDVIRSIRESQITSRTIVCSNVYRPRSKKASKLRGTGLCAGNSTGTGDFPAHRNGNEENVSIWWRNHGTCVTMRTLFRSYWSTIILSLQWNRSNDRIHSITFRHCCFWA